MCAQTGLVRGRSGVRVGLHLTLRHLATDVCEGQPQGFVRSTRSRTVGLDTQPVPCVWTAEDEAAFLTGDAAALEGEAHELHDLVAHSVGKRHWTTVRLAEIVAGVRAQRAASCPQ